MHILLIADGRSPIAKSWIRGLTALNHRVTLVSSYPCTPPAGLENVYTLPVAFGKLGGSQTATPARVRSITSPLISSARWLFMKGRYYLGPLTIPIAAQKLRQIVAASHPDIIHALRIPFEGMVAANATLPAPLLISIWGNDLTLHATGSPLMQKLTRQTLQHCTALMADTHRDIRLAQKWGLGAPCPTLVVPGNGGIDIKEIQASRMQSAGFPLELPADTHLVINPRGFRPGSVRNDTFFKAIPLITARLPQTIFACAAMQGQTEAIAWVKRLQIEANTRLLPFLEQQMLWQIFHRAAISVSISVHDGTPNSLLEAMACGCFPIAGDIESLREWITPGINGNLVNPSQPESLAQAVISALEDTNLRQSAARYNDLLVRQRAEVSLVRSQIDAFYKQFL
ncbi:MAG: glycosyltransferase family 4 protein [Anaerolineae bacterium]|nr:glycosyltransferase family 4 protein [Anaerolineae bacterium]